MVNIIRVLTYEISRTIRRKGFLFTTFGLPLLLFAFTFVWRGLTPSPEQMVQDAQRLATQFDGINRAGVVDLSGQFSNVANAHLIHYADEESALAAMANGEIEAVYILPADYAETHEAQQIIPKMALDDISTDPLVALAALSLASEIDDTLLERLENPSLVAQVDLTKFDEYGNPIADDRTNAQREDANFTVVYLFAILFMMTVFTGSGYLMQSVIEEKENRLIEVLITTVRPTQLLAGKILASGIMALVQVGTWVLISILLMRLQGDFIAQMIPFISSIVIPTGNLGIVAIYFLLGFFMFAALFGMIGALSNSAQEGPQLTVVFILPALIPLYVAPALITDPNGTLAVALSMFPLSAPIGMIMRQVLTDVPLWQVGVSMAILLATNIALYWLAGRLFRVQILLSGKLPRVRDIPALVFGKG